jgi:hypothetical protein
VIAEFGNARFKSVFADTLPTDYVNRVWDVFMYEGQLVPVDAQAPRLTITTKAFHSSFGSVSRSLIAVACRYFK